MSHSDNERIYNRIYKCCGELGFPYPERTYFDYHSTEFSLNSKKQKLLDIGYLLWHGYDVRADIHHIYSDAHSSVSEQDVRYTICSLLAELLGERTTYIEFKFRNININYLIDTLFESILKYYHIPIYQSHYLKSPLDMTEFDIRNCNPWKEVANKYVGNSFLYSEKHDLVCTPDKEIIENFNASAKPEYEYKLNVPVYPWYGNPLKANVIILSLNPGYVERESTIAKLFKYLPQGLVEEYSEHLRSMLTFECNGFLPQQYKDKDISPRDLANIHQSYYWLDRLTSAFVNKETNLNFEQINNRFAVIQYIGYSSKKFKPFNNRQILPSQHYTKQLIQYILHNNPNTVFIVPRAEKKWREFLGSMWIDDRFFVSNLPISQRFSKSTLGEAAYTKVIEAFKR